MKMVSDRRRGFLPGWLSVLLVLGLIAGVTGWFVARSQGFRELLAERLSNQTGLALQIGDSYIGWPYVLVLREIETQTEEATRLYIRELRLGRSLRRWTLDLRGGRITFANDTVENSSNQLSGGLLRLAHLQQADATDIMGATADLRERWKFHWDDIDVLWLSPQGDVAAFVRQVHFQMVPVKLPTGNMYFYRLSYPGEAEAALGSIRNLDWQWLTRGGDHYVEIMRSGSAPTTCFFDE